ncbi:MAG TPA: TonB-dependent receptor plug domain-containing protein, partial [Sphingobium sp.]|nr:TonB-dependent receptor plug domain-containing protein [Sphingobium sp.]
MRTLVFLSSTAILPLVALAGPAMAQEPVAAQSPQPDANEDGGDGLETIVVTARRVEENQQKVPVAVTTLTANALRERNVSSVSDLQYNIPNLQIKPSTLYPSQVEFILRGQRQVLFTDENVVTYVNGVPQGTRGLILYDMENVQSLKGPQGTLFGKNSMGGAMVFATAKPKYDFGAEATFDYGNYDLMRFNGVLNVPLAADVAALRVAGQLERRDGVYKNAYPGMHDLGDRDNNSIRATLLLQPSTGFENLLTLDYQSRNEIPYPAIIEAAPLDATGFAALVSNLTQQVVNQQSALGGGTAQVQGNLLVRTGNPFAVNMLTGVNRVIPGIGPIAPGATPITPVNGFGSKVRTWGVSNISTYELSD